MSHDGGLVRTESSDGNGIKMTIASKLILSFLMIIILTSAIFMFVNISAISSHINSDAQEQAQEVLKNARDVYLSRLGHINSVVRSTGQRSLIREAVLSGQVDRSATISVIFMKYSSQEGRFVLPMRLKDISYETFHEGGNKLGTAHKAFSLQALFEPALPCCLYR